VVRSGQPKRFEEEYSGHWFDVSMYPVSSEQGKVTRLAICAREITKQKKAEEKLLQALRQAQEADLLKSQFLANMSHEIRTPLNAITGLTTLLMLQPDLDEEKRKGYLKNVKHSAESLLAMINAILGLAKIESGTMGPNPVEFHFHDFIESLRNRYQQQMEAKRLRFFLDMQPDVPESLIGDPVLLEQVINNLLGNAYKFTEQGSVRLGVTVSRRKKETLTLQFEVHDTGIGIPPEQQDKVFQAFFQVDGSTTREQQGTGLGLSIARESVRLMGGKIWMESRPKVGTTFFFTCTMKMPRPPAAK